MKRPTVLMPVYNGIEYDGRVRRIASAVGRIADVTVFSLATGNTFSPTGYCVKVASVPAPGRLKLGPHLVFWALLVREAIRSKPDVIHAHDFFLAFPGLIAARLVRARLIYDAHELIIPSPSVPMSRRDRFWYVLERWAVRRADVVIAANAERAQMMQSHYHLSSTPAVVRNIPPVGHDISSVEGIQSRGAGVTRLIYQGDVSLERGVGRFVEAVAQLGDAFELIIVGGGPDTDRIDALRHSLGAEHRIQMLGRVPASHLPGIMAASDIGVICYPATGWNNIYCAPNKLYEYAQAGIPMVATPNPVLDAVFADYGIGVSGSDLQNAIRTAAESRAQMAANIPRFLAANSWADEAAVLGNVYADLLSTGTVSGATV